MDTVQLQSRRCILLWQQWLLIHKPACRAGLSAWIAVCNARVSFGAQAQIEALVNAGTKFSDIFEEPATKVADKEACPSGFTSINAGQAGANRECLKLKVLASTSSEGFGVVLCPVPASP